MIIFYLIEFYVRRRGGLIALLNCTKVKRGVFKRIESLITRIYLDHHNSYLGERATISDTVIFPHGIRGVFISGDSIIGDNCVIFQQVTIGSNTIPESKKFGAPVIGRNCYIGAGAKIIGKVNIGDNCRIGANCIVTEDIPDDSLVILDSPKIISKSGSDNHHYFINSEGNWGYFENGSYHLVENPELQKKMQSYNKR